MRHILELMRFFLNFRTSLTDLYSDINTSLTSFSTDIQTKINGLATTLTTGLTNTDILTENRRKGIRLDKSGNNLFSAYKTISNTYNGADTWIKLVGIAPTTTPCYLTNIKLNVSASYTTAFSLSGQMGYYALAKDDYVPASLTALEAFPYYSALWPCGIHATPTGPWPAYAQAGGHFNACRQGGASLAYNIPQYYSIDLQFPSVPITSKGFALWIWGVTIGNGTPEYSGEMAYISDTAYTNTGF